MIKRYEVVGDKYGDGTVKESDTGQVVFYEDYAALQQKLDAIGQSAQWKPEICPITRRPFFMWIEHPSDGMVPTYGGPLDSYTIPTLDSDGEFCCERFDHDEGCWVDSDCVGICLTNDQEPEIDTAYLNSVRADAVETFAVELAHRVHRSEYSKYFEDEAFNFAEQLRSGTHDNADKAG
ncbi:hypothetical protein H2241_16140 [Pantoea ananatis]|nr:hypothetical protein [Pantoea ananatis]QKV86147.1 hypothetical protein FOB88_11235 [Pantoea ananatis]